MSLRHLNLGFSLLLLSACNLVSYHEIDQVAGISTIPGSLHSELQQRYVQLARNELDERDWRDARYFLTKAQSSALGSVVSPQLVAERCLADSDAQELVLARKQLLAVKQTRARLRAIPELADAQTMFDCWLQEAEEGIQPLDIQTCKDGFSLAIESAQQKAKLAQDIFVVIPGEDGHVGAIVINAGSQEVVLDEAFAAAQIGAAGTAQRIEISQAEIAEVFTAAISAKPLAPLSFILYFEEAEVDLTAESLPILQQVLDAVSSRPAAQVEVIGHTDATGNSVANDVLSRMRALQLKRYLMQQDIAGDSIVASGRGERELLIDTADGIPEPANRRVEVTVR